MEKEGEGAGGALVSLVLFFFFGMLRFGFNKTLQVKGFRRCLVCFPSSK